jgi:tetratricopeptide (TPR) repeat protein
MSDGKYRTAGVVRKLIARTDRLAQESAADYAVVAHLSVEISESLDSTGHALALRGAAWRELGFARYLGGDIDSAAEAEQRARACFEAGDSSPFDLARLDLLQATIQLRCEQTEAALQRLSAAAVIFDAFGARKRLADTIWLRANVFSERKAFETAFAVADEIRTDFDDVLDDHARASVLTNQGYYLREVGEYDRSLKYLREAQFILETIGARTTAVRVAVNIAAVLHVAGQLDAAAERLEACVNDARALGLPSLATLATLQLAEVRSEQQRYDDVERLCREAIEQVGTSAVAYRERALLALALLREVAQQRRASATVIRHVRRYVARLPQEPNLVFAPAPLRAGEDIFG